MKSLSGRALKAPGKEVWGLVAAIAIVAVSCLVPGSAALTHEGATSLGLLFGAVALWCCGTFPLGVTGVLTLVAATALGVAEPSQAFTGFASTTFVYVIGIFALPAVLLKTSWGTRLVNAVFRLTGPSSSRLVLAFMIATALVSTIMTDTPAMVVMMGTAYVVLKAIGARPGQSRLGKALFIAIPFAAIIGGISTPAGSTSNVAAMGMLQELTGTAIPFLGWAIVGMPLVIVLVPVFWLSIVAILKPEPLEQRIIDALEREVADAGKPTTYEKKVLAMLFLIPGLWIAGNWIPLLSIANVSIAGLAVMMAPGMRLLDFDEFQKAVPWNVVLMVGSVLSLGSILATTGGAAFLADLFMGCGILELDLTLIMVLSSLVIYAFHTFCPIGPAAIGLFLPPLAGVCMQFGVSPTSSAILLSFIVAGNFLLPINPTLTITYSTGYYTFGDMAKVGIAPTVASLVIVSLWVPLAVGLTGI